MVATLDLLNYALVLLYGIFLTVSFAGGCATKKERRMMAALCIVVFMLQLSSYALWGLALTKQLYPLITHLPLFLALVLLLKKPWAVALTSILTAYFCCQLPRWFGTLSLFLFDTQLAYQLGYILSIVPLFLLLQRFFAVAAYKAMIYSKRSLLLLGGLPLFYYIFDYATTIYTDALYTGVKMISEFLPAAMALFYVGFVTAYHNEMQRRSQLELDNAMLSAQSQHVQTEIFALQQVQQQTAAYSQDMRRHLTLLGGFLDTGEYARAKEYIRQTQTDIDSIVPTRYCENNAVNLILSAFAAKAKGQGLSFSADVNIPSALRLSDAELCALLSNGLENAVTAAAEVAVHNQRTVRINCQSHKDKLLIYIRNPYAGAITMQGGLPENARLGDGFDVKIIKMIAEKHNGYCAFETEDGLLTLRVVLPLGR